MGGLHGHVGLLLPPQRSTLPGTDWCQEDRCSLASRKAGRHVSLAGGRQVWPGQGRKAQKRRGHAATPLAGKAGARPPRCDWGAQAGRRGGCGGQTGCRPVGERPGADVEARLRERVGRSPAEVGAPATRGGLASRRGAACFGAAGGGAWPWEWEGGRGWARGKRGGRKTSSCSCSQLGRKDALRRTEGSWGGGAGGGRQGVCGARQWRGEDGRVCPAGQKAGLSGVGFEPTPPGETAT